jgi:hypothetical protein
VYLLPVDPGELESLGLYDPTDEHAALRLELLRYLIDLGASADDLTVYRDTLPGLAAALAIRGGPLLTVEEVGQRSGLTIDEVRRLVRVAGFPDPEPGVPVSRSPGPARSWSPPTSPRQPASARNPAATTDSKASRATSNYDGSFTAEAHNTQSRTAPRGRMASRTRHRVKTDVQTSIEAPTCWRARASG